MCARPPDPVEGFEAAGLSAPVQPADLNPTGRREFTGAQDVSPAHGGPPLPMRHPADPEQDRTDVFPAYPTESHWPTDR